ncbi:MAG: hypothetical protein K0S33_1463 [Bacteroidetes bacterium]|jgi:hypothetical protein|nr:hypothetical protein [Bacteroidota bacterium]
MNYILITSRVCKTGQAPRNNLLKYQAPGIVKLIPTLSTGLGA